MASRGATEWAKVLDVDRTTVHKWWSGDAFPRGRQLEAIARETGKSLRFVEDAKEAAPPDWAERLMGGIFALEAKGEISAAGFLVRRWEHAVLVGSLAFVAFLFLDRWASYSYWLAVLPVTGVALERLMWGARPARQDSRSPARRLAPPVSLRPTR